ncbi:MAG: hypothetical protein OXF73_03430 [Gammaproteobacteria bacterium]|nr:hypothetical protein [Gammaproteobacteria bacterium]MCY4228244.1 hypothetical protein [Gammaproteobacteria bacterium]
MSEQTLPPSTIMMPNAAGRESHNIENVREPVKRFPSMARALETAYQ